MCGEARDVVCCEVVEAARWGSYTCDLVYEPSAQSDTRPQKWQTPSSEQMALQLAAATCEECGHMCMLAAHAAGSLENVLHDAVGTGLLSSDLPPSASSDISWSHLSWSHLSYCSLISLA
eukprot:CAMPEP_0181229138 /NCGR_PEP_ID=MMETSP1096-20121128/33728_1 /TAXON_ID=156174 ORGANISM="Chrysochromulina ericina, Strain CCMP281" /NCGR_SAMPLE_ID=MMETSP1096 /ASSEMBLY_ACC=CAM_ASM_000453 /LENGTH=119 /DNA_ID=CAMNT_0023322723 /DNA_START=1 /DNA_END=361 /DNA_ORIENTATION=-